jgi:hypothetical protein
MENSKNLRIQRTDGHRDKGWREGGGFQCPYGDDVAVAPGDVVAAGEEVAHRLEEPVHLRLHRWRGRSAVPVRGDRRKRGNRAVAESKLCDLAADADAVAEGLEVGWFGRNQFLCRTTCRSAAATRACGHAQSTCQRPTAAGKPRGGWGAWIREESLGAWIYRIIFGADKRREKRTTIQWAVLVPVVALSWFGRYQLWYRLLLGLVVLGCGF